MIVGIKMSVPQIIRQIDEVIRDTRTSREEKIENLQNLAMTCWQEVVPEYENLRNFSKNLNPQKGKNVGRKSVMKWKNMKRNPKFCMFLIGRLPAVISIG